MWWRTNSWKAPAAAAMLQRGRTQPHAHSPGAASFPNTAQLFVFLWCAPWVYASSSSYCISALDNSEPGRSQEQRGWLQVVFDLPVPAARRLWVPHTQHAWCVAEAWHANRPLVTISGPHVFLNYHPWCWAPGSMNCGCGCGAVACFPEREYQSVQPHLPPPPTQHAGAPPSRLRDDAAAGKQGWCEPPCPAWLTMLQQPQHWCSSATALALGYQLGAAAVQAACVVLGMVGGGGGACGAVPLSLSV